MRPGPQNLITDVPGILVGNANDPNVATGTTVLTAKEPFTAGYHVMGGAPGSRETDLLAPDKLVREIDALVLSGGSAMGLSAASGVADALRASGRGFDVGGQNIPIVPAAILFDLLNGGDKNWRQNPYDALGRRALSNAASSFDLGSAGAGYGATTANLRGGLGSASLILPDGTIIGALVAVNALGSATVGDGHHFWAAPWEIDGEFGGLGVATDYSTSPPITKPGPGQNTTIGIVATDARLTKSDCTRLALSAHDGLARALVPSHTLMDGDLIFAAATGARGCDDLLLLGHAAAICMARAIARADFLADPGMTLPAWSEKFSEIGAKD